MLILTAEISEFPCVVVEFFALVGYFETQVGLLLAFIIIIIIIIIITIIILKTVQDFFLEVITLEDWTDTPYRNVGNNPAYAEQHLTLIV